VIGDNITGLIETDRQFLRVAAWTAAALLCCVQGLVLSAKASLINAATRTFLASVTAAVPVVAIGLLWFPGQFMRDTELFSFLIWMTIPVTLVSGAYAVVATVASVLARLPRRFVRGSRKQIVGSRVRAEVIRRSTRRLSRWDPWT
jgi:hypothetical protein